MGNNPMIAKSIPIVQAAGDIRQTTYDEESPDVICQGAPAERFEN